MEHPRSHASWPNNSAGRLWDQHLTSEIARGANCQLSAVEQREERRDPLYYRLLKSFTRGSYEGSMNVEPMMLDPLNALDSDSIVRISRRMVEKAAAEGNCVMVGTRLTAFSAGPH